MATITLSNGALALVDDDLFDFLSQWKWHDNGHGYAQRGGRGDVTAMHRDVIACPAGLEIDHVNGDKLDNRRKNLRVCTRAENARNRKPQLRWDPTLPKGVSEAGKRGRFVANLSVNGCRYRLGTFDSPEEAAAAYDAAAIKHHGEFARPNSTVPV